MTLFGRELDPRPALFGAAVLVALVAWYLVERKSPQEVAEAEASAIASDASATASLLLAAQRQCKKLRIAGIPECSAHQGPLPEEKLIATIAGAALSQLNDYRARCQRRFAATYCDDLVNRSLAIQYDDKNQ